MTEDGILAQARRIVELARQHGLTLATAESCTGGLVAAALTAIEGSSVVFDRGFVTYSNGAKQDLLGVSGESLATHGAVSQAIALEMAGGARSRAKVDIAVSVTGIAGPGGWTEAKPVGLVHFGLASERGVEHREMRFGALGRDNVRYESVRVALELIESALLQNAPRQVGD
ncbi:CinA family protein [Aureimonas sp. AU40]|uniref:CinA family protein n=1 Tax=Aureimonas sp. AU40 TaxID=1637747 RepID=UPI0007834173|nr:CinA family protein [Aureimonas sp. AU40]